MLAMVATMEFFLIGTIGYNIAELLPIVQIVMGVE